MSSSYGEPLLDLSDRSQPLRSNAESMRKELLGLTIVQAIVFFPFGLLYFTMSRQPMKRGRQSAALAVVLGIVSTGIYNGLIYLIQAKSTAVLVTIILLWIIQVITSVCRKTRARARAAAPRKGRTHGEGARARVRANGDVNTGDGHAQLMTLFLGINLQYVDVQLAVVEASKGV